jgi:CRISPR-associated protein Csb1
MSTQPNQKLLEQYDPWLSDNGPAALVIREHLLPVEGRAGVLFPATFAAEQGNAPDRFPGGYNIDRFDDGTSVCLIDSVGAQANRIEPVFAKPDYAALVPQITIKAGNKRISILEAGHRAGDALVRCCPILKEELQGAFKEVLKGNAEPLAKIAPTSLVFGVWDSRDTQAKLPRLVASTIRAFNIRKLTRHAQYVPATAYVEEGLLPEPEGSDSTYAERGFKHQPIGRQPDPKKADPTHGGVIAGAIRRDATLSLAGLRLLRASEGQSRTHSLQRYILGLALTAFTHPSAFVGYLRQGCNLVLDSDAEPPREFLEVYPDGRRSPIVVAHHDALTYAKAAADDFGVGKSRTVDFDPELAKKDVAGDEGGKKDRAKRKPRPKAPEQPEEQTD